MKKMHALCLLLIFFLVSLPSFGHTAKKHTAKSSGPAVAKAQDDEEAVGDRDKAPTKKAGQAKPYLGAILIDAASGRVLFEDNADSKSPPASIIKLMNLLVVLESIKSGSITLQDKVTVTAEASKTGGSQVYLKEGEEFTIDELLYALMVQSANDAAVALAIHVAGTKDAFVDLMNRKAKQLGMTNTNFNSVHGLPPGKDQEADISTPRDIAKLCQELLKWDDVLRYSSVKERAFRENSGQPFIMRNHNHLIGNFEGCDGFKTGFYRAAGFSLAATAKKKNARAIAVVFGSENRHVRDAKTKELLAKGLAELIRTAPAEPAKVAQAPQPETKPETKPDEKEVVQISMQTLKAIGIGIVAFVVLIALIAIFKGKKKKDFLND